MRVLTWNINSVRLRLPLLEQVVALANPDVICLQETKVTDDLFPKAAMVALGYPHIAIRGMKSYNGVAICSKLDFELQPNLKWFDLDDARHLFVRLENGVEIHNFYVPAGGDEPDTDINPKFAHKLGFLREMTAWFQKNRTDQDKMILVGDLNIAPLEQDVWSHRQLLKVVSHTPIEVELLNEAMNSVDFQDSMRKFVPEDQKLYSWWSYRGRDWERSDRGRRLDHVWASQALQNCAENMQVMKAVRGFERPSDHAPIWVDFNL
ncbi:MAG: exodeoxyribonuclease III [Alphaproteobacteria bacterium]